MEKVWFVINKIWELEPVQKNINEKCVSFIVELTEEKIQEIFNQKNHASKIIQELQIQFKDEINNYLN